MIQTIYNQIRSDPPPQGPSPFQDTVETKSPSPDFHQETCLLPPAGEHRSRPACPDISALNLFPFHMTFSECTLRTSGMDCLSTPERRGRKPNPKQTTITITITITVTSTHTNIARGLIRHEERRPAVTALWGCDVDRLTSVYQYHHILTSTVWTGLSDNSPRYTHTHSLSFSPSCYVTDLDHTFPQCLD